MEVDTMRRIAVGGGGIDSWAGARRGGALLAAAVAGALVQPAEHVAAQGTAEDYRRALSLEERYRGLVTGVADGFVWQDDALLTFRRSVAGGHEFRAIDAGSGEERPAFDHARIATALGGATGARYAATTLPFTSFTYVDDGAAVDVAVEDDRYRCVLAESRCSALDGGARRPADGRSADDGEEIVRRSPDGRLEAFVRNYNIAIRATGSEEDTFLSQDGSEGNAYAASSIAWSPDSRMLAAYRVAPGHERLVHYVDTAPDDQLQPRHFTRTYTKPGDRLPTRRPVLFDVEAKRSSEIDDALFPNAYAMSPLRWREDGREVTFEYNERGHGTYRIVGIDRNGAARAIIDEVTESFFYYRASSGDGKMFRHDIDDGREVIWMSERDGWNHLYLFDGATGRVKNQITRGEWVVRDVVHVDEENRQITFAASGMNAGEDPYFVHFYRIGFDGSGLTPLTEANGTHEIVFSPDRRHYAVTWSRVDLPPIAQLRRTADRSVVAELGRGDMSALLAAGWRPPEVFTAKGRDGATDIWGIMVRPSSFDSTRSYPVIESIYAGPHDNHVPKAFTVFPARGMMAQAEVGFMVVMIDGMGTSNRSKAFHDVAWKNLGDAGFPDRILWHRAVAAKYPYYDLGRVGIYGGSAGGQNALGALLFHGDFYHAAVADNGCHDNRMDKIWWNELWMSWPLGPHYAASSNVEHAHRLRGKLLLTVSELDSNVDPASTYQVADALIRAGKDFEFLTIPGGEHARGPYHERKRFDFFVRHLLGGSPPDWNNGGIAAQN
jgi:dipeptidyl aminopeptidase/acylaminoacyl peptidase